MPTRGADPVPKPARQEAERPPGGDRMLLQGLRFFGRHGSLAAERQLGSHVVVDLEVGLDVRPAADSDRIEDALDYTLVYETVRHLVEDDRFRLLETLASRIAEEVLALPRTERVLVRVTKQPRLPAQTSGFAVEVVRP